MQFDTLTLSVVLALLGVLWWELRRQRISRTCPRTAATAAPIRFDVHVRMGFDPPLDPAEASPPDDLNDEKQESTTTLAVVRQTAEAAEEEQRPMRFLIDSMLLSRSFQFVCPSGAKPSRHFDDFKEAFHYVTGVRTDERTFVITHIVPVRYSEQTSGRVRVADGSNIAVLATLDRLGLPLLGHMHSHPGFGRYANQPSSTDRAFQERLERGGHLAVGAIFSRDGFVRWFAGDLDRFVVEVQGNNVKKVGDNEFKLELEDRAN